MPLDRHAALKYIQLLPCLHVPGGCMPEIHSLIFNKTLGYTLSFIKYYLVYFVYTPGRHGITIT